MKDTKKVLLMAARIVLALAGIVCIIVSMVTDIVTPYLAIGMGLVAIANFLNQYSIRKMRGEKNGSAEDRYIS